MISIKKNFLPILTVLFLGYLGFSFVLPLFPPLFLDQEILFLPLKTTQNMRRILLGLLFTMYPIGQFLGAPLLGKFSDKYGRKPILLISLLATIPTYISCALSLSYTLPGLLFLSRFLCGLLEGNIVIAQAAIADISENRKEKTKNFGWLVSFSSAAFFFGPLIGGVLANDKFVSWFGYDTPFWAAALLVFLGFLNVYFFFKETATANKALVIDVKKIFLSFIEGVRLPNLSPLFSAHLLIFSAMFFFLNFFSTFLVSRFDFTVLQLGYANAYLSLFLIFSPLIFKQFSRVFPPHKTLIIGALVLSISLILFVLPHSPWALLVTLIPIGIALSIAFGFPAILVSERVSKSVQGQALGTNLSIQVLAEALTALFGGFLLAAQTSLPFFFGACTSLAGALLLTRLFYRRKKVS